MTGEELERAIAYVLENRSSLENQLSETNRQVSETARQIAETNRLLQAHAETQTEFIQIVLRHIEAQGEINTSLRETAARLERHIPDGHGG